MLIQLTCDRQLWLLEEEEWVAGRYFRRQKLSSCADEDRGPSSQRSVKNKFLLNFINYWFKTIKNIPSQIDNLKAF